MDSIINFILMFLQQFAGGPGPAENNLMRFGLAAILWLTLLAIAWSRQRSQDLPRERLLVVGFGLAFARELVMFVLIAGRMQGWEFLNAENVFHHPLEHALEMMAIIVVAGAYLRYILDNEHISRRYLQVGIGLTGIAVAVVLLTWPSFSVSNPTIQFHQTWQAWIFHVPLCIMIAAAMFILARKHGWLRNVVILALGFFFISEFLVLVNFSTQHAYSSVICPIGNSLHILAIPILGYVYLKEQSIDKKKTEDELRDYRYQLENLVEERTAELSTVNAQLAALNSIAATISQSLDLETILNSALEMTLSVLKMEVGAIFLLNRDTGKLTMKSFHGEVPLDQLSDISHAKYSCIGISYDALKEKQAILQNVSGSPQGELTDYILNQGLQIIGSTPILFKGVPLGALTIGAKKTDFIGNSELDLLTAIGQQVGMAIENARLYQEADSLADNLTLLHQLSINLGIILDADEIKEEIVSQTAKLVDCQMAYILSCAQQHQVCSIVSEYGLDPPTQKFLVEHSSTCMILQDLVKNKETIVIPNTFEDARIPVQWKEQFNIRTVICLPLWIKEEPYEFLFLMDRRTSKHWRPEERKLIEAFADRASAALENAHLYKQLERAATLEERQRIAADMHDGLAQTLSLLGLRVDKTKEMLEGKNEDKVIKELMNIRNAVGQASAEVRRSIASLSETPVPAQTMQAHLSNLINQVYSNDRLLIRLETEKREPLFLPQEQITQILPIVQEALLNAVSHSQANSITLKLEQLQDQIRISIIDNGIGFDPRELRQDDRDHFGLSIMRARANRVGGRLKINSAPGFGTRVILTWNPDGNPVQTIMESDELAHVFFPDLADRKL